MNVRLAITQKPRNHMLDDIKKTLWATADKLRANMDINQAVAIVRPLSDATPSGFILRFLNRAESKQLLGERVVQAVQANLSLGALSDLKLVLPESNLIRRLFKIVFEPIDLAVTANRQKARTLATLCDTLLPSLISGQLHLPKARAQLEAAA
jgi:type I restriction enzyme S subunit